MSAEQAIGVLLFAILMIILLFVAVWLRGRQERTPRIYQQVPAREPEPLALAVQDALLASKELQRAILEGNAAALYTETARTGQACHLLAVELEARRLTKEREAQK